MYLKKKKPARSIIISKLHCTVFEQYLKKKNQDQGEVHCYKFMIRYGIYAIEDYHLLSEVVEDRKVPYWNNVEKHSEAWRDISGGITEYM